MEHLSSEVLSRLVDESPDAEASIHLESCDSCREEIAALRAQTEALRSLPDLRPPVEDWEVIEARLVSEGLVRRRGGMGVKLAFTPGWMRVAAAVLLFLSGSAVGAGVTRTRAPGEPGPGAARTTAEAAEWVRSAEQNYVDALLHYSQLTEIEGGGDAFSDPATRYAALDYLVTAGQLAVRQAPADPFLNGFLASAMAERQAVLRRISSSPENWF
jgi:anti-sigma factor RsiW